MQFTSQFVLVMSIYSHEVWQSAFGKSFDNARDAGGLLDWGDP